MRTLNTPVNVARFDLVSIRLAVACAQTGSLSAAARECHLALAAASRRIRDLESAVGATLFERHARGVTPTAAGRLLLKHGLTLLQTTEQLGRELADERQGVARHIRLCAGSAAISQFLPPLLARYAALQPQVRVDLDEQVSDAVVAALREGRADVGVFVGGPDTTGLTVHPFRQDELVLLLPARHRLARGRGPLAFVDCLEEDWISLTAGAAMLQTQQEAAQALGRPLRLRMQVRSFDAVCHLVAAGLGVALLPRAAALPLLPALPLACRALRDTWARRTLWVGHVTQDAAVLDLARFLVAEPATDPSQNAKPPRRKRQ